MLNTSALASLLSTSWARAIQLASSGYPQVAYSTSSPATGPPSLPVALWSIEAARSTWRRREVVQVHAIPGIQR